MERILLSSYHVEKRRFRDILAIKRSNQNPVAFHSQNLEVAEISNELWQALGDDEKSLEHSQDLDKKSSEIFADLLAWNNSVNPEVQTYKLKVGIKSLTINVTQICNLKCSYCAAGGDGTYGAAQSRIDIEKTLPQLKFFLERLKSGENFNITFLGGEPLLYPQGIQAIANYVTLMTAGQNISVSYKIVTNGTLFTEANLHLLARLKAHITLSLDGPRELNDLARPSRDGLSSTDKIIAGLTLLKPLRNEISHLGLHGVFTATNLDLVKAYEFYQELDQEFQVDRFTFTLSVEEEDSQVSAEYSNQMNLIAQKAFELGGEKELRKIELFDLYFDALDNQRRTENHCGSGKSFLVMDSSNRLYTCPWEVGNKQEQIGQNESINLQLLENDTKSLIEQNDCGTCWAKYLCGGGCMYIHKKATGNKHQKSKVFCERTQNLIATSIIYYKQLRDRNEDL